MTRDEIMQMARVSDAHAYTNRHALDETAFAFSLDRLTQFANLVAEKEREACAQLCMKMGTEPMEWQPSKLGIRPEHLDVAQAIRARGQK